MSGSLPPHGPSAGIARGIGALAVAVAGAWVFRRALGQFFSADDFAGLARAAGLSPHLHGLWRYLSGEVYFDAMRPLSGLNPVGYHAVSLALHLACAVLLYLLLQRALSTPGAFAGAVCFATHPAHFTVAYWVSAVGSPMALLFSLLAVFAALRRDRRRWLAVPLFALALLAKEAVVFLPLAIAALLDWDAKHGTAAAGQMPSPSGPRRAVWADPLPYALGALSLVQIVTMERAGVMGPATGAAPYALSAGRGLLENAFTYLGWTADFFLPTVLRFQDAADPLVYGWGLGLLLLWLAGLGSSGLRRRGWLVGGAFYLAFLLPVLPIAHHTYHYYLYAPLVGLAWCLGAALDWAFARLTVPRPARHGSAARAALAAGLAAWSLPLAAAVLLSFNATLLVSKIETMPFMDTPLRADPTIDRGLIANHAIASLRQADLGAGVRLLFWSPLTRTPAEGAGESYFESNVRTALFDGLAVRLFFRQVDSVGFVHEYRSLPASYRWAVYRPDGVLRVATSAELESSLAAYRATAPAAAGASPPARPR